MPHKVSSKRLRLYLQGEQLQRIEEAEEPPGPPPSLTSNNSIRSNAARELAFPHAQGLTLRQIRARSDEQRRSLVQRIVIEHQRQMQQRQQEALRQQNRHSVDEAAERIGRLMLALDLPLEGAEAGAALRRANAIRRQGPPVLGSTDEQPGAEEREKPTPGGMV